MHRLIPCHYRWRKKNTLRLGTTIILTHCIQVQQRNVLPATWFRVRANFPVFKIDLRRILENSLDLTNLLVKKESKTENSFSLFYMKALNNIEAKNVFVSTVNPCSCGASVLWFIICPTFGAEARAGGKLCYIDYFHCKLFLCISV